MTKQNKPTLKGKEGKTRQEIDNKVKSIRKFCKQIKAGEKK